MNRAAQELDHLKQELVIFEQRDQPAYQSWLFSTFSELLNEINQCAMKIYETRRHMQATQLEARLRDISLRQAYENVLKGCALEDEHDARQDNRSDEDDHAAKDLFEEELRQEGIDPTSLDPATYAERFAEFKSEHGFDRQGSRKSDDDSSYWRAFDEFVFEARKDSTLGKDQEKLKRLYRILARKLHPDMNRDQTDRTRALWLEVQEAYESRDLPRLEALVSIIASDIEEAEAFAPSLWDLKQRLKQLIASVKSVRKSIRTKRRERAWGFSRSDAEARRKRKRLKKVVEKELEAELEEAREALYSLETLFEQWLDLDEHWQSEAG